MDTCGICGEPRRADLMLTKVADGWICAKCLRDSALATEIPDFSKRNKAVKKMTLVELKSKIDNAEVVRAAAKAERDELDKKRREAEEEHARHAEERREKWANRDMFPVTTVDLNRPYQIVGPVFFQTSNKGIFSSSYSRLASQYREEIAQRRSDGTFSPMKADWDLFWDPSVGQNDFDPAFYICVEELKRRAIEKDADAIVGLKVDFDLDTNAFQYFYVQAYGTAVRFTD